MTCLSCFAKYNYISGGMVSVLASRAVDREFVLPTPPPENKPKTMRFGFVAFPLNTQH